MQRQLSQSESLRAGSALPLPLPLPHPVSLSSNSARRLRQSLLSEEWEERNSHHSGNVPARPATPRPSSNDACEAAWMAVATAAAAASVAEKSAWGLNCSNTSTQIGESKIKDKLLLQHLESDSSQFEVEMMAPQPRQQRKKSERVSVSIAPLLSDEVEDPTMLASQPIFVSSGSPKITQRLDFLSSPTEVDLYGCSSPSSVGQPSLKRCSSTSSVVSFSSALSVSSSYSYRTVRAQSSAQYSSSSPPSTSSSSSIAHARDSDPQASLRSSVSLQLSPSSSSVVFHSFLLDSLCPFLTTSDLVGSFARVHREWNMASKRCLVAPARSSVLFAPKEGGTMLWKEVKRIERIRCSRAKKQVTPARDGDERGTEKPEASKVTDAPSATLIQHLQLLPPALVHSAHASQRSSSSGNGVLGRLLSWFSHRSHRMPRPTDFDCQLLSRHLRRLRILRIFDGSLLTNEAIGYLVAGMKELRVLHIGALNDSRIDDRTLEYLCAPYGHGLRQLHSLWLTQDTTLPLRTWANPHPRIVYNLFSQRGVAQLLALKETLQHLNLGGFRNLTIAGLRSLVHGSGSGSGVSASGEYLSLHSLHLNGHHITDEALSILRDSPSRSTLYYLHLFDVSVSGEGLRCLARMEALETLVLDRAHDIDEEAMEAWVEESRMVIEEVNEEAAEEALAESLDAEVGDGGSSSNSSSSDIEIEHHSNHRPRILPSLSCLELSGWPRLTRAALLRLIPHPTLRDIHLRGGRVGGRLEEDDQAGQEWTKQIELFDEMERESGGRIRVNGGIDSRRTYINNQRQSRRGSSSNRNTHPRRRGGSGDACSIQ